MTEYFLSRPNDYLGCTRYLGSMATKGRGPNADEVEGRWRGIILAFNSDILLGDYLDPTVKEYLSGDGRTEWEAKTTFHDMLIDIYGFRDEVKRDEIQSKLESHRITATQHTIGAVFGKYCFKANNGRYRVKPRAS